MLVSLYKISNFPPRFNYISLYKKFYKKILIKSNPDTYFKYNLIINLVWDFNPLENLKEG